MALRFDHTERMQRGRGIGGLLSSIFRPLMKGALGVAKKAIKSNAGRRVLKSMKNQAIESGANVLGDVIQGRDIGESVQQEFASARKSVGKAASKALFNLNKKRKRPSEKTSGITHKKKTHKKVKFSNKRKKTSSHHDIF